MPFLPFPPTSEAAVAEALQICMKASSKLGNTHTIVTQDLAVYEISYGLRHANPELYDGLILRLGGFHLQMNFLGSIGKLMLNSGLKHVFVKAMLLLPGTADNILNVNGYYQSMRAHMSVYEGMLNLWWDAFEDWCKQEELVYQALHALPQ
jgi:hypothetical protein